ncbi:hypothetical protein DMENIID0001_118740 [Sergentomyia squamirostris]
MLSREIREFFVGMQYRLDEISIYLPHIFMEKALQTLPEDDVNLLTHDFQLWITEDLKTMEPHIGDFTYGIPSVTFNNRDTPSINTSEGPEDTVALVGNGCDLAAKLMKMIFQRFENGDSVYFKKYHQVVCSRKCSNPYVCGKLRKFIEERESLIDQLRQPDTFPVNIEILEQNIVPIPSLEFDYENQLQAAEEPIPEEPEEEEDSYELPKLIGLREEDEEESQEQSQEESRAKRFKKE